MVQKCFPEAYRRITHPEEGGWYAIVLTKGGLRLAMTGPDLNWMAGMCTWEPDARGGEGEWQY